MNLNITSNSNLNVNLNLNVFNLLFVLPIFPWDVKNTIPRDRDNINLIGKHPWLHDGNIPLTWSDDPFYILTSVEFGCKIFPKSWESTSNVSVYQKAPPSPFGPGAFLKHRKSNFYKKSLESGTFLWKYEGRFWFFSSEDKF